MNRLCTYVVDDERSTFFAESVRNNNSYACRFMLMHNPKIVRETHQGRHILQLAGDVSNEEITMSIAELVDDDTLKGIQYDNGDNLLIKACHRKMYRLVRFLLMRGFDPRSRDESGRTLLELLVVNGVHSIVELLIDHYGLTGNDLDSQGNPMIFRSLQANNSMISELLLRSGVEPEIVDKDGVCLLEWTVRKGWYLHTSYLFRKGCKSMYGDERLFHRLCYLAVQANSSIIFHKLISNYMASVIQRAWRRRCQVKKKVGE